jgi:hypothetical protein
MAALGRSGNHVSLGFPTLLRFHRLAEAVPLTLPLEALHIMGQVIQERRSHALGNGLVSPTQPERASGTHPGFKMATLGKIG